MLFSVRFLKSIICLSSYLMLSSVFAASVLGVSSGDTLTLLDGTRTVKVRLAFIDAPEPRQPYANHSRRTLTELCSGKEVKYKTLYNDRKKQAIAVVYCNGINVNRHLVKTGMAWVYDEYNQDTILPQLQNEAQKNRIGLWKDSVVTPPWEFRRLGFSGKINGQKSFTE